MKITELYAEDIQPGMFVPSKELITAMEQYGFGEDLKKLKADFPYGFPEVLVVTDCNYPEEEAIYFCVKGSDTEIRFYIEDTVPVLIQEETEDK